MTTAPFLRLALVAGLLAAAPLAGRAQPAAQAPVPALNTARLDSLLATLAAHDKLMGSLVLSHEGQVVYSRAFGLARVEARTPATPATRYGIGSISKMFTATMIFQLIEEKKLALTTPLATFFPQVPGAAAITIDLLLSHRSGLHNFTDDAAYQGYMTRPKTQAEMVGLIAAAPADFAPGAKAAYSNANFVLLGYVVERLTRLTYAQALQQRVGARVPRGLPGTSYGGPIAAQPLEAYSYERGGVGWQRSTETDRSIPGGAGALVSTPTDLARFLEALFGGKLVGAGSLAAMQDIRDGYGRAMFRVPFYEHTGYGHTGGIDAFRAVAYYFPTDHLAVTLCTNGGTFAPNDVLIGALSCYFGRPYRVPTFAASAFVPAAADLARYAGTYGSLQIPLKITMTVEGTTLRSQATGQPSFLLEPVRPGEFTFDPAHLQVEFAPARPAFTLRQGGGTYVFTKE